MKLKHIFERREQHIPVEVKYEHPEENKDGDVEYHDVIFYLDVMVTPDAYGTGDSPTDYEVNIIKAYYEDGKKPFNWKSLSKKEMKWIKDKAVEQSLN